MCPGSATKAERISRPSSVRIGIACRFGLVVERRPVAATAWLMVVCRRPSSAISVGQRPEVRVQELRVLAPLLDHADDLVLAADRAQDARVGRVAGLALAAGREAELVEQDPADLLGRAEHELLARELVRPGLELLDHLAQARRDLAHAVLVDLDSGPLHRGQDGRERELDVAVERLHVALADAVEEQVAEPVGRRGVADERRRLLVGGRLRLELEAVLGGEVVERVLGPRRLDQVGERGACRRSPRHAAPSRRGRSPAVRRSRPARRRLAPRRRPRPVPRRTRPPPPGFLATGCCSAPRATEPSSSRAASALPERPRRARPRGAAGCGTRSARNISLSCERSGGERTSCVTSQSSSRSRRIVASSFDCRAWSACSVMFALARGRELVRVLDHLLERAVLRDQLAGRLVADAGDARDVVRGVALEPDEVRDLVGPDPVAGLDALGRVDVDVRDAARGHHQRDVLRDELERVAVGRDDASS